MTWSWNCSATKYRRVTNLDNLRLRPAVNWLAGRKCYGYCVCSAPRFPRFHRAVRLKSIMWDTLTKSHLSMAPWHLDCPHLPRTTLRHGNVNSRSETSSSQLLWRHCGIPLICIMYAERHWRKSGLPSRNGIPRAGATSQTWLRSSPNEYIGKF